MTDTYELPDEIPFTTVASDFEKLLSRGGSFQRKEDLIDYAATDFLSLKNSYFLIINFINIITYIILYI